MVKLTIVCVGKLKEEYWKAAEREYLKRLQSWVNIEIKELKEESFTEKDNIEQIKKKEAIKIISSLPKDTFLVILSIGGKQLDSIQFSEKISSLINQQNYSIAFVVGGPLGLDESVLQRADLKLSLSLLTFTHQMARVILLEQIYRSYTILTKRKYHY